MALLQEQSPGESQERECIGRDEMNLSEFPIAMLSGQMSTGCLTLRRERTVRLGNGQTLQQAWIVTGTAEYGLPQASDEDVLLGLLKLGADEGFETPIVHFTQRSLLSLLRWTDAGRNYQRLDLAIKRLATTKILANNCFWDNDKKCYHTRLFGIIDGLELFDRAPLGPSTYQLARSVNWVRFSNEFYGSLRAGYIKPINLGLYFSLRSTISKRLYRYLDKKRYQKDRFEINLQQLASVHVGLAETKCRYTSSIKQQLALGHSELLERGFLKGVDYVLARDGTCKVVYRFPDRASLPAAPQTRLAEALRLRGVSPKTSHELVANASEEFIEQILDVFDYLNDPRHGTKIQNPGGFLTKAIKEEWALRPPGYVSKRDREQRAAKVPTVPAEISEKQDEQKAVQAFLETLSDDSRRQLRLDAHHLAQQQLGRLVKIREDSPLVDAFLSEVVKERFPQR